MNSFSFISFHKSKFTIIKTTERLPITIIPLEIKKTFFYNIKNCYYVNSLEHLRFYFYFI